MALKLNYDFLFVGKDDNSFLENYSYDLYEKYGERSGEIFINLEVQNNPANSEEIGEAVFGIFQEEFFANVDEDPYKRFEAALKAVNIGLSEFKSQKVSGYIGNMNVVIAAYVKGVLYVTQSGDAEAYLIRKRYLSVVTDGLSDENSDEIFSNIASGEVEEGDTVLLSSTRLLRYVSKNDLAKILSGNEPADVLAELKDVVATEMLGRVGLTAVCLKEGADDDVRIGEGEDDLQGTLVETSMSAKTISTPSGTVDVKSVFTKVLYGAGGVAKTVLGKVGDAVRKGGASRRAKSSRNFRGSVSGMGSKIGSFKKGLLSRGFGGSKVLVALAVVIGLLIAGVWAVKSQRDQQAELEAVDNLLIEVQNKISEAETRGQYDKEAAGQILAKAQEDAMSALNTDFRDKANILLQQIEETRDSLDEVKRIKQPTLVADLTEKRENISALGFTEVGDRIFVFEYNALYELVLDQVQDPITIDEEETVIASTGFDDRDSVVFLTKSGKLIEYREGTISFMDTEEESFHKGVALEDWGNRIYVLDPDNNQVWKYTYSSVQDRFGVASQYASEGDLAMAKDFAIDGSVWFLNDEGLEKYYAGVPADLIISKKPFNAFHDPLKMITDGDMAEVFVLDASENRVMRFYKDENTGNLIYSNQYLIEGVGEIRDFIVDLNAGRMKVLTPTAVYEFDL
ncbi:hypothetical protein HOE67_02720 [Candidatus Peregrinibacteria bacterium]|jgi:hypothetical protein|nr:hypothetical protein [Candidatus Peregrinibacteria bacterium]MBT4056000.1 hypothetical protein [Candidatus Peregrinibacteria bacterium]